MKFYFPSKGNRRLPLKGRRPSYILQVETQSSSARRKSRHNLITFSAVALLLFALAIAGYIALPKVADRLFFSNDDYNIRKVITSLDGVLSSQDALALTDIHEGKNIFCIDLADARTRLLRELSMAEEVSIERNLFQRTVTIKVKSRKPIAWVAEDSSDKKTFSPGMEAWLCDKDGRLMKMQWQNEAFFSLPVIYGVKVAKLADPSELVKEDFRIALALLNEANESGSTLLSIRSLDISRGWMTEISSAQGSVGSPSTKFLLMQEKLLNADAIKYQLDRINKLLVYCNSKGQTIATANLAVQNNVPVTFQVVENSLPTRLTADTSRPVTSSTASAKRQTPTTKPPIKPTAKPTNKLATKPSVATKPLAPQKTATATKPVAKPKTR